ncbi:hypothetical protein D3C85_889590 [compost metagenome]
MLDTAGLLLRSLRDLADDVGDPMHRRHDLLHRRARLLGLRGTFRDALYRILDQGLDLFGGLRALLGQAAHLARHHGESLARLARARSLHRGVQCQDVRLKGDAFDDGDDVRDLARTVGDAVHGIDDLPDRHAAAPRNVHAAGRQLVSLPRIIGILAHRGRKLFHAGRGLLKRGGLPFRPAGQLLVAARDVHGRMRRAFDAPVDVLGDADQALAHDVERELQAAHFVVGLRHDLRGQVARGHLPRHVRGVQHRLQQGTRQAPSHVEDRHDAHGNRAAAQRGAPRIQVRPVGVQAIGAGGGHDPG